MTPLVPLAFVTGFLGSGHCLGMCGGLVCGLSLAGGGRSGPGFHLAYNAGRIITYAAIGAFAGWAGSAMAYTGNFAPVTRTAMAAADIFVIAVGAATVAARGSFSLANPEPGPISKKISRAAAAIAKIPGHAASFVLGLLMGFLPCGFLYAMLMTAAASGSGVAGAAVMTAFGAGTAPSLFGFGWLAGMIGSRVRGRMLTAAGVMVTLMGIYNLYRHIKFLNP